MLAANIEAEVTQILEKKGRSGWLRVSECAKLYGKGNASRETKFYRWRKKVGKGKVKGFQVLVLPGNISFIGLESADPCVIESLVSKDKKLFRSIKSGFGFFEWLERRAERKQRERDRKMRELYAEREIIHEMMMMDEYDQEKEWKIRQKWRKRYGLDQ